MECVRLRVKDIDFDMAQITGRDGKGEKDRVTLLPQSLACEAAQFAVAGALEPADHVGGDTFDYAIDRDTLQLSVTDAMGQM